MTGRLRRFLVDRSGATAIEYCFIAGLIALAIVTGVRTVGGKLQHVFTQVAAN